MNPVTIVLPVHNVERTLRRTVARIMDLMDTASRRLRLVVVDDGSIDGTYETACELAREYPQLAVLRQPFRGGLGAALEQVRRRLGVEQVVAHDGVTPIDLDDLAGMLNKPLAAEQSYPAPAVNAPAAGRGSRRFSAVASLHARMAEVHQSASAFRWLRLEAPAGSRRNRRVESAADAIATVESPATPTLANSFANS